MKKLSILLTSFILLCLTLSVNAQSLRIGIGGGFASVNGPSALVDDISNNGAGLKNGYEIGGKLKLDFPLVPFRLAGQAYYISITNEGNINTGLPGNIQNVKMETSMSLFSVGAGVEYQIIPGPVSPYLALDLLYNSFGEVEVKYNPSLSIASPNSGKPYSNKDRFGLGIGLGTEFTLLPVIDLDLNVKYNLMNLMGKEDMRINGINFSEESFNTITVTANILFGL